MIRITGFELSDEALQLHGMCGLMVHVIVQAGRPQQGEHRVVEASGIASGYRIIRGSGDRSHYELLLDSSRSVSWDDTDDVRIQRA